MTPVNPPPSYAVWKQRSSGQIDTRWALSARRVAEVRNLIRDLQKRNVRVLVVNMPVNDDWVRHVRNGELKHGSVSDTAAALARTTGVAYFDAGRWSPDLFADHEHLNPRGTARFSALMRDTVLPAL